MVWVSPVQALYLYFKPNTSLLFLAWPFLVFLYPPAFIYFQAHLLIRVVYISGDPGLASLFTVSHLMKQAHEPPHPRCAMERRGSISKPVAEMLRTWESCCDFHWKSMTDPSFIPHSWAMRKRSHTMSLVLMLEHL